MFDRRAIYSRFAEFCGAESAVQLAGILGLNRKTVYQWESGARQVPWKRLKLVVDEQGIRWDWILEGKEPKNRPNHDPSACRPMNRREINQRYLSLFPALPQAELGNLIGVSQAMISYWVNATSQVPWEKLKATVDGKGVTWDWLLEGK
ncbi:MAG: hypothetical protein LUD38_13555 [Parabacteroides sp.]|nr:hypothetical protein [Parabacteroides sp.]